MGVIESLSAGFRFVGRRFELLLIPILLDLLLWALPRLSVAPLFDRLATLYLETAAAPEITADTAAIYQQLAGLLQEFGRSTNLLGILANQTLLHVPSLMAVLAPQSLTEAGTQIDDAALAVIGALLLGLVGMLVGVFYLNILARHLPLGEGKKWLGVSSFLGLALMHWLWILVFVLAITSALILLSIPTMVFTLLLAIVSPALLSGMMLIVTGMVMALFFYLYFVVVGLVLDNLSLPSAVWRSVMLVRHNFWPTLGFVLLTNLISVGFALIWSTFLGGGGQLLGLLLAILGNAYIGTGLAMGLLVFYRTRLLRTADDLRRTA